MSKYGYVIAHSVQEALALLGEPGHVSKPLAGGTDLMVSNRLGKPAFDRLVDISRLPELRIIERRGNTIYLGAGVTFTQAAESSLLQEVAGCLVEACRSVGGPQIRNAGTLGGNVVNAAPCADSVPALVCLDCTAHLRSLEGERQARVSDLVLGAHRCDVGPGELLTGFHFDLLPKGTQSAFIKLGRREAQAISRLSMAAAGRIGTDGKIDVVRLTPGAAMPHTSRLTEIEDALLGQEPADELLAAAGVKAAAAMVAITGRRWSTEYKEVSIQALAERALRRVLNCHDA
jgi:CO/xanthine dehydrogenase FAD-binding subunit